MKDDEIRKLRLEERFSIDYPDFHIVEALDYRNVSPDMLGPEEQKSGLTPAEVGCTKSHILAMKSFLDSDNTHCLILEDDVLGTPQSIKNVKSIENTTWPGTAEELLEPRLRVMGFEPGARIALWCLRRNGKPQVTQTSVQQVFPK